MPQHDFMSPRLFVEAALTADAPVRATPEQVNYAANVMRLKAGDTVLLFNGRDGEWRAEIVEIAKKKLAFHPRDRVRAQPAAPDLHYLFAPLKHARLDYMVQKAVEMGAGVLQPVLTQHGQANRVKLERMNANAVEAAAQCGVLSVPACREPVKLAACLDGWDPARRLVVCDEREDARSPVEVLRNLPHGPLALLIGPEGGFSHAERARLAALDFVTPVSLGPRILRADTAAVAALALLQATAGDWRTG